MLSNRSKITKELYDVIQMTLQQELQLLGLRSRGWVRRAKGNFLG
jgi:hypothetical protein